MTNLTLESITLGGLEYPGPITVQLNNYLSWDGPLAVQLMTHEDGYPELLATVSVNLPDERLADGAIFVKDYSENEGVLQVFIDKGWLKPTGRSIMTGWVTVKEAEVTGDLLEAVREHMGVQR